MVVLITFLLREAPRALAACLRASIAPPPRPVSAATLATPWASVVLSYDGFR